MNKLVGSGKIIQNTTIKGGLIVIGNNTVMNNNNIYAKSIGVQVISQNSDVLQDYMENDYESAIDIQQNFGIEKFLKDKDTVSLFTTWALSQKNIFEEFLKDFNQALNNETMVRVLE